jgi:hypothetical protein
MEELFLPTSTKNSVKKYSLEETLDSFVEISHLVINRSTEFNEPHSFLKLNLVGTSVTLSLHMTAKIVYRKLFTSLGMVSS